MTLDISTPYGSVRGLRNADVASFLGIRYATAARFDAPTPVTTWDGVLDATEYGPQCPQLFSLLEQALGSADHPAAEDCLSLSVFTPGADHARRPVLVWIHGGGYTTGSSSMPWYDGTALAQRGNAVVVTINYRLGAFGFSGRSNCGLRDIVAALQFVHDTIASFGGDPDNVTIVGESAGGSAVIALLAVASADGLFQRAFAMSPSINQLRTAERADEALAEFLTAAGASHLDELREVPVQRILDAQGTILSNVGAGFTGFSPCGDGDLVAEDMLDVAAHHAVPLVIGTTRDEMHLFSAFNPATATMTDEQLERHAVHHFGEGTATALGRYRAARSGASCGQLASAIQTDEVFRVPARHVAEARVDNANPTWMYWFTWPTPAFGGMLGSCHAIDIPFLFHNLDRPGVEQFTGTSTDRARVADVYADAVLALAHHGDPGWPQYDLERRCTLKIDVTSSVVDDPEVELRVLW